MKETTEYNINQELARARRKFPSNVDLLCALMEEVGELAAAMNQCKHEGKDPKEVYTEAIHVISTAIRIAEEGDPNWPYEFKHEYYQRYGLPDNAGERETAAGDSDV